MYCLLQRLFKRISLSMKLVLIAYLLVVVHSQPLISQSNNYTVTINKFNTELNCLYNSNDTIHIAGHALSSLQGNFMYLRSIIYPNKTQKNTLDLSNLLNDYSDRGINLIKTTNSFISCSRSAHTDTFNRCVIKTDITGKITKKFEKGLPKTRGGVYFQNIYQNSTNSFIVNAYIDFRKSGYPYYNYLIYKLDSNFNTLDSTFVDSFNYAKSYDIKTSGLAPNGSNRYRIIINNFKFNCDYNSSNYDAQVVDFDSSLKIIKSKSIPNRKINITNSIHIDKNRTIIYGERLDTNLCLPGFQFALGRPFLALIDSNLNISWEIHYDKDTGARMAYKIDRAINKVIRLKDGNFFAVGSHYYQLPNFIPNSDKNINPWGGLVIKFDINGKILWSKRLRYDDYDSICPDSYFSIRDVTELKNGDLFAIGAMAHDCDNRDTAISAQRGWIMRLDSKGEVIKNQILSSDLINTISVYPNPFTEKIQINNLESGNYSYCLYNTIGQKIKEEKFHTIDGDHLINISSLPIGNYILNILDDTYKIISSHKLKKN
jgi:hypothetical protein